MGVHEKQAVIGAGHSQLSITRQCELIGGCAKSFFDDVDWGHLRDFLDQRVRDGVFTAVQRLHSPRSQMPESGKSGSVGAAGEQSSAATRPH